MIDEGAAEAPKQHLSGALAVFHELRSGDSSASSKVVQVDVEDRRDVKCSQGTVQSAAARAWQHAQIGATALISRSAALPCRIPFHLRLQHVSGVGNGKGS